MLSTEFPRARRSSRLAGAAGALLLQGGFVFLFLYSMPHFRPARDLARELTLILRPMPKPAVLPAAPAMQTTPTAPVLPNAPEFVVPVVPGTPPPAVLPGLQNFGQALNGCAPETYNSLTPAQRALCPRPGAGVAIQEEPSLLGIRPEAKDEALWQEQWDEAHWPLGLCDHGQEASVALCLMHQSIAESERAADVNWHLARDKAAAKHR